MNMYIYRKRKSQINEITIKFASYKVVGNILCGSLNVTDLHKLIGNETIGKSGLLE